MKQKVTDIFILIQADYSQDQWEQSDLRSCEFKRVSRGHNDSPVKEERLWQVMKPAVKLPCQASLCSSFAH